MEAHVHTETSAKMFTAALLKSAPNWKQSQCPTKDKWINSLWYIHTKEYYSAVKKDRQLIERSHLFESQSLCWMKEPGLQRLNTA